MEPEEVKYILLVHHNEEFGETELQQLLAESVRLANQIDAKDLDDALAIAARVPGARIGTVEVRPVMEIPDCRKTKRVARASRP